MMEVVEMAKAHLQNVAAKIQELENQQKVLQSEIDKLKNYLNDGLVSVNNVTNSNQAE